MLGSFRVFLVFQFPRHFLTMFPKCARFLPKVAHCVRTDGAFQNVPLRVTSGPLFWLIFSFTGWEHCNHTIGETASNSLNEPLRNTRVLSLGKFKVFPSFSNWGHCGHMTWNTANVLQRNSLNEPLGNTAGKLAGKILNVPGVYQVGTSLVLYPFPCNVLAVYQLGSLALAPSDRQLDQRFFSHPGLEGGGPWIICQ